MKLTRDTELDTVEIIFKESDRVVGAEVLPGVVIFTDHDTADLCSIEILFFSEYPDVWKESLETLGYGYLMEFINSQIEGGEHAHTRP